jgi:hypothetical protein
LTYWTSAWRLTLLGASRHGKHSFIHSSEDDYCTISFTTIVVLRFLLDLSYHLLATPISSKICEKDMLEMGSGRKADSARMNFELWDLTQLQIGVCQATDRCAVMVDAYEKQCLMTGSSYWM